MKMSKFFAVTLALTIVCGEVTPLNTEFPDFSITANATDIVETAKLADNITYTLDNEGSITSSTTPENPVKKGKWGDNVIFEIYENGTLKIMGEGPMFDNHIPMFEETIKEVVIEDGVTSVGKKAFYGSWAENVEKISLPNSIVNIGSGAFIGCKKIQNITIPDSVTSIESRAFSGCSSLESITIPDSVKKLGYEAFSYCSNLKEIVFPNNIPNIPQDAFSNCSSLESIIIPDSVIYIDDGAFKGCGNLTSIKIPDSVKSIGKKAFQGCVSLKSVIFLDSVIEIGEEAFDETKWLEDNTDKNPLFVINGILVDGRKCSGDVEIPDSVTSIVEKAFFQCRNLKSITIPDSVTSIGENAFSGCSSLESIIIPDSVTRIGREAFWECSNLKSITGYGNSKAEQYANANNITFISLGAAPTIATPTTTSTSTTAKPTTPTTTSATTSSTAELSATTTASSQAMSLEERIIGTWEFENFKVAEDAEITEFPYGYGQLTYIFNSDGTASMEAIDARKDMTWKAENGAIVIGSELSFRFVTDDQIEFVRFNGSAFFKRVTTRISLGDLTGDGKIDANDATLVLVNYSLLSTGEPIQLTEEQQNAADVNGDGKIDASDATMILQYYSYLSTGGDMDFKSFIK